MVPVKSGRWRIRVAEMGDWSAISRISTTIAEEGLVGDYITDIGPKYLGIGKTLVIEEDEIMGYHNIQDVPDGSIYLSGLRVAKEFRKMGIATELTLSALKEAASEGKKKARAYVEPGNTASISLLSKAGFIKRKLVYLYFGTVKTDGFSEEISWPDSTLDVGHVPSDYYDGIPAKLLRKGQCSIAVSEKNMWDNLPSFTIFNPEGCGYSPGDSFVISNEELAEESFQPLRRVQGFESAYLMEKEL